METRSIKLNDKELSDTASVDIALRCLSQIGGFPAVASSLETERLAPIASPAYHALKEAVDDGTRDLALNISVSELKAICNNILNTLEEYGDHENILGISQAEAKKLIASF